MKPGVQISSLYTEALAFIELKNPELKEKFTRNCGHGVHD